MAKYSPSLAISVAMFVLAGCMAAPPKGPEFDSVTLAAAPADKALLVVFRAHAEPTGLAARIYVGDEEVMRLPQEAFGVAVVEPGDHPLALKWPSASATPGWEGNGSWLAGQTYFYELTGTAGQGFYFRSQLGETDARLADLKMRACCRLNTQQMGNAAVLAMPPPAAAVPQQRDISLGVIKAGMLPNEVLDLIGPPNAVSSKYTGAGKNPFSFSADTFREYWEYTGVGFVAFSHNNYTNTSRVIETAAGGAPRSK
ncbi:MAG: hypothetical protein ABI821_11695 [Pseudomonadota bacterium]